jgi:hypothetical protein
MSISRLQSNRLTINLTIKDEKTMSLIGSLPIELEQTSLSGSDAEGVNRSFPIRI